jgi:hypothetical protein
VGPLRVAKRGGGLVSALVMCARCGETCDATGARRCDCEPRSELGAVVIAAVRLAGPEATVRDVRTWMRRVAAARRDAS